MTFDGRSSAKIRAALEPFLADVRAGLELAIRAAHAAPALADAVMRAQSLQLPPLVTVADVRLAESPDFASFIRDAAAHVQSQIEGWHATHAQAVRPAAAKGKGRR